MINLFEPQTDDLELKYIKKTLDSKWLAKGNEVFDFEKSFSKKIKTDHLRLASTNGCSQALFIAAKFFNFNNEDEIIAPSISFHAVGNCIVDSGAKLVLCDVDKHSLNTNVDFIKKKVTNKTKAIILNHYGGIPCEMDPIIQFCDKNEIVLIEDTACSPFSFYKSKASGTFGDMGLWSFDPMKVITTLEGGMIYLNAKHDINYLKEQIYLGLESKVKSGIDSLKEGNNRWWEFEITNAGNKSIMNNLCAAIGLAQLEKLKVNLSSRKKIHEMYCNELSKISWLKLPPSIPSYIKSSYYFFWIQLEKRDELANFLFKKNIYTTYRYHPLHKIKYFGQKKTGLENSEIASRTTLCIPIHQSLSDENVKYIISCIKDFKN